MIVFFIFIFSFLLTFFIRKFAIKNSIIDIPNERSSHSIPTPRGGGLAIVICWFSGITYLYAVSQIDPNLYFALMAGVLISGVSFLDDIINLSSKPRLIIHAIAAAIALYYTGGLKSIDFGFFEIENIIILTIFSFIGIIWFTNLYNFIDGIDGYAASEAIFVALSLWVFIGDHLLLMLAASVLGFLPWNWQKAKIFMGDVGSTLLGFTFAVLAVYYQNIEEFSILNWLILTSLFWFDATYTLIKRFLNKEKINQPHKKHIYQKVIQSGVSHQKTVLLAMFINSVFLILVIIEQKISNLSLVFFIINQILLILILRYVKTRKLD